MLNFFWIIILSLGYFANVYAGKVVSPIECPSAGQFFHSSAGNSWAVSAHDGDWKITTSGPGDNSTLTSINAEAALKVHLTSDGSGAISGVSCTYTLSDQTVLKAETAALNGHCPPSEEMGPKIGNFYNDPDKQVDNSPWSWNKSWNTTETFCRVQVVRQPQVFQIIVIGL